MLLMVIRCAAHLQEGSCLQKTFYASKRLVLLALHHLQMPAAMFHVLWWHCHSQNCRMFHDSIAMTSSTNMSLHLFHAEALQSLAIAIGIEGRTKVKGCNIASTAWRKSHYFIVGPCK
jgi:hypothetical protein